MAVHRGGIRADATSYGVRNELLPEHRPANAVDGDPGTAWRTAENDPTTGERLVLTFDDPARPGTVTLLQPSHRANRWITQVELRFDGGDPLVVDLDERSRQSPGQVVDLGDRRFRELSIEVRADSAGPQGRYGGLTSVGFAEVVIGDGARRLDELIRPPVDLLGRTHGGSGHPLAFVLTRLRSAPTDVERLDEEPALARLLTIPEARRASLAGTARLSARAPSVVVDALLGVDPGAQPTATASSTLPALTARPAAVLDGDPSTAWTAAYGDQVGQWLAVRAPSPVVVERVGVVLRVDDQHSVPTRLGIEVDGAPVHTAAVTSDTTADASGTVRVDVELPSPVEGSEIRVVVDEVAARETTDWGSRAIRTLPVSVAEIDLEELPAPAPEDRVATGCRDDLLHLDGDPIAVEVTGDRADALLGLPLEVRLCDDGVDLGAGEHVLRVLDHAAASGQPLPVRWACLLHDLGKADTPAHLLPHHYGHEAASARRAREVSERLKAPTDCRDLAEMVAREHGILALADELRAETMVKLIERCDGLRRPERFALMLAAAACDQAGRGRSIEDAPPARPLTRWQLALAAVRGVDAGTIARNCRDKSLIPQALHAARVAAVKAADKEMP